MHLKSSSSGLHKKSAGGTYGRVSPVTRSTNYLTLRADKPAQDTAGLEVKHWVRLSWVHDVLMSLQNLVTNDDRQAHPSIVTLIELLT